MSPVRIELMRTSLQNDVPPGASRDAQWKNSGFTIYEKTRGLEEGKYVKDHKQGLNQGEAFRGPLFSKPWKHDSPHALKHSIGACSILPYVTHAVWKGWFRYGQPGCFIIGILFQKLG